MAQFDLHRNKGPRKDTIPYLVIVQSALFDGYRRRLVVPLVRHSVLGPGMAGTRINPSFKVRGATVVLHPLDMVSGAGAIGRTSGLSGRTRPNHYRCARRGVYAGLELSGGMLRIARFVAGSTAVLLI